MSQNLAGVPFAKRNVPLLEHETPSGLASWARKLSGWLATEFGNVQRGQSRASSRTVTAATTVRSSDAVILANAAGAPFTVTLPAATSMLDNMVTVKKIDASANAVTLGGTVDGTLNPTLATRWSSMTVIALGTTASAAWYKVAST